MARKKKETVKGYKVFNNDWTCRDFQYKIGETYHFDGKISLCEAGFHFCEKLEDCFKNYACVQWNKIAEVEASGKIIKGKDKCVTDTITLLREISFNEIAEIYKNQNSDGVNRSYGVNDSNGVNGSNGVNHSDGISCSDGVNYSYGVSGSDGVNRSYGVNDSNGVNRSYGVSGSDGVNRSYGVNDSDGVNRSYGVSGSDGVNRSYGVNDSDGVNRSNGVNDSYGIFNCFGISSGLFCADFSKEYFLFNKKIKKERWLNINNAFRKTLNGWTPSFNNLKGLYLKSDSKWAFTPIPQAKELSIKEAWADMPQEAIEYLKSLPEFDADIFEKITGKKV